MVKNRLAIEQFNEHLADFNDRVGVRGMLKRN